MQPECRSRQDNTNRTHMSSAVVIVDEIEGHFCNLFEYLLAKPAAVFRHQVKKQICSRPTAQRSQQSSLQS